ncbi:MAG: hypothetical protein JXQ72_09960 [Anaerolineae bacterium]|nr:hypothetical protein [Anaerolineae bacterium]
MSSVQRITLGPEITELLQGRSAHGRWRGAHQPAGTTPDEGDSRPARLWAIQDYDRLVFALAEGPAANFLSEQIVEHLWARETAGADWPQEVRDWLAGPTWREDAPPGRTGFVCGRLERNIPGGRVFLAWLGMDGVRLLNRAGDPVTLDTTISPDEAWTPRRGPEPVGMALHAYRGSLFGLDRLMVYSPAARPVGEDLPDLANAELDRARVDWGGEAPHDLVFFDIRLNPVLTEPTSVQLSYRWTGPDQCELTWFPATSATAFRIEESESPDFEDAALVAELTDTRQSRYSISPPASSTRYYRIVPLNQGVPGPPSDPISPTPIMLTTPILEKVEWSADGGYFLRWTPIAQATSYEVQSSTAANFDEDESQVIYRGELPETYLSPDTPPNLVYRVRAINVLYAPQMPSGWSQPQRAPLRLETPRFIEVTQRRIVWDRVSGARQYAVRITGLGQEEVEGDDLLTGENMIPAADQPARYRIRAFRKPGDQRTASEWSEPVTISPPRVDSAQPLPDMRTLSPLIFGAALVALLIGTALGLVGLNAYQDYKATATRTPLNQMAVNATRAAATQGVANATGIAERSTIIARLTVTGVALGRERSTLQAHSTALSQGNATLEAQNVALTATNEALYAANESLNEANTTLEAERDELSERNESLIGGINSVSSENQNLRSTMESQVTVDAAWTQTATSWTATPTPSDTPDLTGTVAAAVASDLTATAAGWTATPTPSDTPDLRATVAAAVAADLTATAAGWTATPTPTTTFTPTDTPDMTQTLAAAVAAHLTATVADWTATPSPTITRIPSETPVPTDTPDLESIIEATINAALAGTLTALPPVNAPPDALLPSPTINWQATVDAFAVANLGDGCYVIAPPDASPDGLPPVYDALEVAGSPLLDPVPRFVPVTGQRIGPENGELWLRVLVEIDGDPVEGWVPLPDGAEFGDWVGGPACDVAADVPAVDEE